MDLLRHLRYLALLIFILATYFSTVLARQHGIRHRHHRHKRQHASPARRPTYFVTSGAEQGPDSGTWGPWSGPSPCSRSCGGGVASQQRRCEDISDDGQPLCTGGAKRYFSCNIQDCPEGSTDFRAEQCSAFDSVPFEGRLLQWEPYTKAPNKCELNCKPHSERYYYRHKTKVIDGTRCEDEKLDICVDGKCMPVGCDMMLGSPAREDLCRECRGDGTSCSTERNIYEMDDLQAGYNDILLIPAGATNIVVREVKPSNNYLAIRNLTGHYYLNGNWRIENPMSLRFAGTLFHYERKHFLFYASESLTALGPTTESIFVVLLYQETNPGIEYQFSISKGAGSLDPDSYSWIHGDFIPCSATCGGGYQLRNVTCARRRDLEVVEDKLCNPVLEPERNRSCGTDLCAPTWFLGEWGSCSKSCGYGGSRVRQVFCKYDIGNNLTSIVDGQRCVESVGTHPPTTEPCNEVVPCPTWFTGPWKPCNRLCGEGQHTRQVVCYHKIDGKIRVLEDSACQEAKPPDSKPCILRLCEGVDWVYSDWSGCEDKCGLTQETRTAVCSNEAGKVYPDSRCYQYRLKELIRECENQMTCEFEWFASQWSECSADCGTGVSTRKVFCGTFDGETVKKVPDAKCDPEKRYEELKNCSGKEVQCPGQWQAGPWSACSKKCGGGVMERKVFCFVGNNSVDITKCDHNSILFASDDCNKQPCSGDQLLTVGPDADLFGDEYCEEEPDVILTTLGRGVTQWATDVGTKAEVNASSTATTQLEPGAETVDGILSDSPGAYAGSGSGEITLFDTTLPDTLSTFYSTDRLPSVFTPLTMLSSSSITGSIGTESTPSLTTVAISSDKSSTDFDQLTTTTYEEITESIIGNVSVSPQTSSLASTHSSNLSLESSSSSEFSSVQVSDTTTTDDLSTSVSSMSSLSSDGTTASLSGDLSSVSHSSNSSFGTSESASTESSSYFITFTLNDTEATLPPENSSSTITLTSNNILSTSDLTSSTYDLTTSTYDLTLSTSNLTSSTSDLTSHTDNVNSSTSDVNASTSEVNSSTSYVNASTSDITPSTSDLTSSTSDLTSSTSDLTSSTSDLTSSTSDLTSSTSDLTSSTSDLSLSTSDISLSTSDLSLSTSDPTVSSNLTSTFSSASSSLGLTTSFSGLSSDEGSGITGDSVNEFSSTSLMTNTTTSTAEFHYYNEVVDDDYPNENEASGKEANSPGRSEMVTEKSLSTVPVDNASSVYTITSVDTTIPADTTSSVDILLVDTILPVDTTSPVDTTLPVDTTASSGRVTTEMPTVNDTSAESPSLSTTESSVMPTFLDSSTVSKGASTFALTESSSATTLQSVDDAIKAVTTGNIEITTAGLIASSITPGTEKTRVSTSSEEVTTSYTTPVEVGTTAGTTAEVTEYEGESLTTPSVAQSAFRTEQKLKKCKKRKTTPVTCQASAFGCCFDNITSATGPFGKGCPHPTTCTETEHGCCSDGVSPAEGPDDLGCPSSTCAETLFGCCPDGEGVAQGNDYEGCEEPTFMPVLCNATEFGCCPDEITPASGPGNEGCFDMCEGSGDCDLCNNTVYGCCLDGITAASGENFTGCDVGLSSTTTEEPEEAGCSNSTYGCCPDGFTVAEGPYFYGCEENCTDSYFGCCPDGITPAKGSHYEGCRMPCQDERYGCCSDGKTAAHGPNQEGCCLNTPHGCCPDNIIPAQGPSLEGCGCLYSPYGCCPDNTTAARGPNKDGCGCQYTSYGCCPDAYTPAAGPNYKGCPCYTYQFGCCPDGISISKGPHGEDCGCQNTQFGCCSDGKTPAAGPRDEGCGCEATKYGCCPDGETPAQGDKFEECLDSPIVPSVACLEPTDRGTCRDYKVKWFFDAEYGGCSRFWYGGCEGNNNRFNSKEECKATCVEPLGRAACYLPKILGPCKEYHPTWYYDAERKQCGQFIYGGCLGNNNKFQTREECDELCVLPDTIDVCEQPQMKGPCRGNFTRWYYNYDIGQCQHFSYGGCKGNGNNFFTETACQQKCLQRGKSRAIMDICALPKDMGPCPGAILRWYYDATDETCKQFVYGGCQGNANRFRSEEECRSECRVLSDAREQDTCLLPAMVGECSNYTERWFYDSFEVRCRTFYYGGCGGNHNNFPSMEACQQRCEPGFSTPKPAQTFLTEYCFKEYDQGPCSESVIYWFYDKGDGVCKQFIYGGCQGNENRFASRQECEKTCGEAQDICTLPRVVGPCEGRQSNWYYDPASDSCQEFEYGGCQGNGNRFADQQACEERCQRSRIVTPRPTLPTPTTTAYPVLPPSNICIAPVVRGPCSEELAAWYYDASSSTCQAFIYSGCGGNANRFESEEQCERLCGPNTDKDICNMPYDVGTCSGEFPKWYYDPQTKSCQRFIYGGCTGNGNRFSSISECEMICLHRDEPRPSTNYTEETAQAICSLPVDIGPCNSSYYKRWYFNGDHRTCLPFLYSGCAGNLNKFKSFQICEKYCSVLLTEESGSGESYPSPNEIDVGEGPEKVSDQCEVAARECSQLRCPYRIDKFMDGDCTRCRCHEPCRGTQCPEGTQCAVDLFSNPETGETESRAVCRQMNKPGLCPRLTPGAGTCHKECDTDADCAAELKCCFNGCGSSCISPFTSPEQQILTTQPPPLTEERTYQPWTDVAPSITSSETALSTEEEGVITMHCVASGRPTPSIIWRKGRLTIMDTGSRHKLFPDGRLQITAVKRSDAGTYTCFANNGVGQPAQLDFTIDVKDPVTRSAEIVGEDNMFTVVKLGAPTVLQCRVIGWPRPLVTWFHGSHMMPRDSQQYEIQPDFSLHIRTVTLSSLGPYTCQAYNGVGRPASWTVTLQAVGPVHLDDRDKEYVQYIVPPPEKPRAPRPTTRRPPAYPYRPTRPTRRPPGRQRTRRPGSRHHRTTTTPLPALITNPPAPLAATVPDTPRTYRVPVKTNVTMTQTLFPVGSSISIPCDVDGYPIPTVTWYKDEVPLQSDDRIQISESHRLIINQANSTDTGMYRCEAVNDVDKSSSATSIVVEGIYIHPNCTDNPFFANCRLIVEARYCTHKYYARFCCKSCTIAGQLPSFGPHLQKSGIITSNIQD